jgi:hypothetical protein
MTTERSRHLAAPPRSAPLPAGDPRAHPASSVARFRLRRSRSRSWTLRATTSPAIAAVRYLPTATLHDLTVGHSGHGSARTPDTPPWTPEGGHPDAQTPTPDTGQRSRDRRTWTLDAPDTGHRTLAEDVDTVTKARPASSTSWAATPNGGALGRPTLFLGTALAALGNRDGSAGGPPARVRLLLALPRSCSAAPAKSRLGALLSLDDFGSSVGRRGGGHPVYGDRRRVLM